MERLRNSPHNTKRQDIVNLLEAYEFVNRGGRSHDVFQHKDHKELRLTLPRHRKVKIAYVKAAVDLVDRSLRMIQD